MIGLIDGVFEDRADRLAQGDPLGARPRRRGSSAPPASARSGRSSARAFGMEGDRPDLRAVRRGTIEDDHELALAYAPRELGWHAPERAAGQRPRHARRRRRCGRAARRGRRAALSAAGRGAALPRADLARRSPTALAGGGTRAALGLAARGPGRPQARRRAGPRRRRGRGRGRRGPAPDRIAFRLRRHPLLAVGGRRVRADGRSPRGRGGARRAAPRPGPLRARARPGLRAPRCRATQPLDADRRTRENSLDELRARPRPRHRRRLPRLARPDPRPNRRALAAALAAEERLALALERRGRRASRRRYSTPFASTAASSALAPRAADKRARLAGARRAGLPRGRARRRSSTALCARRRVTVDSDDPDAGRPRARPRGPPGAPPPARARARLRRAARRSAMAIAGMTYAAPRPPHVRVRHLPAVAARRRRRRGSRRSSSAPRAGAVGPGPSDRRMYTIDAPGKRPYGVAGARPPCRRGAGRRATPAMPSARRPFRPPAARRPGLPRRPPLRLRPLRARRLGGLPRPARSTGTSRGTSTGSS